MIQPVFMFAFLTMFLVAFDVTIYSGPNSLYKSIYKTSGTTQPPIGTLLNSSGAYMEAKTGETALILNPGTALKAADELGAKTVVDTGDHGNVEINDNAANATEDTAKALDALQEGNAPVSEIFTPKQVLNWDALSAAFGSGTTEEYKLQLFVAFLMAMVVIYVFYEMIEFVPFIGSGVSSSGGMPLSLGQGKLAPPGAGAIGKMTGRALK
jgi:preprotein translocase subunit SecF